MIKNGQNIMNFFHLMTRAQITSYMKASLLWNGGCMPLRSMRSVTVDAFRGTSTALTDTIQQHLLSHFN